MRQTSVRTNSNSTNWLNLQKQTTSCHCMHWKTSFSFILHLHRLRQEKGKSTSVCSITSLKRPCQKRYKRPNISPLEHLKFRIPTDSSNLTCSASPCYFFSSNPKCRDALTTRQKLISQDYRVSYSLAKACKLDLRKQRCSLDTNLPRAREARLSYLLLCLEAAVHRGECFCETH